MAIPYAKSGYSTEPTGYVDNPIPKQCGTCEYFRKLGAHSGSCGQEDILGDPALLTDESSGRKFVSPVSGCCNFWEPAAKQPLNLVYVVRHGETSLNASNSFRGNVDVDLDAKGVEQARAAKAFLSGIPFSRFISSSKERTQHTMEIILGESGSFETTPSLQALDVGDFSGQKKTKENLERLKYFIDHPTIPIPGGESLRDFQERVRPILKGAIKEALGTGSPILLVAHSSVVHEVGAMLAGDSEVALVEPGGVAVIFKLPGGKLSAAAILNPKPDSHGTDVVS